VRNWAIGLIAGVSVLALTGCVDRSGQEQAKKVAEIVTDQTTAVMVKPVSSVDAPKTLELTGSVVTDDDVQVSVKSPGRLVAVYVKEGAMVSAGQVIAVQEGQEAQARLSQAMANVRSANAALSQAQRDARVTPERSTAAVKASEARVRQAKAALAKAQNGSRSEEKAQAKANVDRAKSDLELARKNLERSKRLEAEGAISKAQLEVDQNRFDNAQAGYTSAVEQYNLILEVTRPEDIEQLREQVRQAEEQLNLDRANKKLDPAAQDRVDAARAQVSAAQDAVSLARIAVDDLKVIAPMSGKISGQPLQPGTVVSPGVPVARLVGTNGIFFEAEVPEKDIADVAPGMAVDASVDALGDVALSGTVVSVSPSASDLGRLFKVRVSINEAAGKVKPGMFVRGTLKLGTLSDVFVVPNTAVQRDGQNISVFIAMRETVDGESMMVARKKTVTVIRTEADVAIVDGLENGEQLITSGQSTLFDGAPIRIDDGMEKKPEAEPSEAEVEAE
jgi:RND family efflux transporter MFP subunit